MSTAMAAFRIGLALGATSLVAVALVPAAASPGPAEPAVEPRPLLGIVATGEYGNSVTYLVRVQRASLRPVKGRRIAVGPHLHAWAFSPNGSRLAFSPHPGRVLRFVDARTLRPRGDIVFSSGGLPAWLAPRRLLWVETSEVFVVDPIRRRFLARRKIEGRVLGGVRAGDRVALLVAPAEGIGPSRLLVVDAAGGARSIDLDRILAGWTLCGGHQPGVAVDPAQRRVFVVGTDGVVAEVELGTTGAVYHSLERTVSPLPRAEVCESRWRTADWLGEGMIAVSGFDREEFTSTDGRRHMRIDPAGLDLVDVRNWSARTLDEGADSFRFAERQLLATGSRTSGGAGLAAYTLDGSKRFHLFEGKPAWIAEAFARRAYVTLGRVEVAVVDVERGVVLGKRKHPPPRLLLDDGVSLFGR